MPDALKISTKPSATSEYMSPAATPPNSTSTRNRGEVAMSTKGATRTAYSACTGAPRVLELPSLSRMSQASSRHRLGAWPRPEQPEDAGSRRPEAYSGTPRIGDDPRGRRPYGRRRDATG